MDLQKVIELNNLLEQLISGDEKPNLRGLNDPDFYYDDEALLDILFAPIEQRMCRLNNHFYKTLDLDIARVELGNESFENYEKKRLEYIDDIRTTTNTIERLQKAIQYAHDINEWEIFYNLIDNLKSEMRMVVSMDVCYKLFKKRASMKEIIELMPWLDICDIYGLSIKQNMPIDLTDEERDAICQNYMQTGRPEILKEVFGELTGEENESLIED